MSWTAIYSTGRWQSIDQNNEVDRLLILDNGREVTVVFQGFELHQYLDI